MYNSTDHWLIASFDSNSDPTTTSYWSREEDKIFEKALLRFPEGINNRFNRIADFLPGKTPVDVESHYEALLHDVSAIESGRVEPPIYLDEERVGSSVDPGPSSSGSTRRQEGERKKGRPWTEEEHRLFVAGLEKYGKGDWRSISRNVVISRTPTQVASHAQKYFLRQKSSDKKERKRSSIHDITTGVDSLAVAPPPPPGNPQ